VATIANKGIVVNKILLILAIILVKAAGRVFPHLFTLVGLVPVGRRMSGNGSILDITASRGRL
jgi:hypothetical protein